MSATLVLPANASRDEWLARRRIGLGASEIAAVMGISPYDSPFSLWWRKHMGWDIEASDEMRTGTFLESAIAVWFADHAATPSIVVCSAGLYAHPERPWQLATPDRLLHMECAECEGEGWTPGSAIPALRLCEACRGAGVEPDVVGLLECKWVAYSWDGWGEDGTSEIPVHYRAQVLWQMDVMGLPDAFVCALGPGGFRTYQVRRDEADLVMMRESARRFMASLAEGEPPDVDDHSATLPILRRINAAIEDREQEIPGPIATGFMRARRFKALADKVSRRYAAELRAHLGTAKKATYDGRVFAARSTDDKLMGKS